MKIKINIVDAGSRYGIHPNFEELRGIADFHLFEVDKDECTRLKKKYKSHKNIKVYNQGLYSKKTIMNFNIRNHNALNSIYETNNFFLNKNKYKKKEFEKKKSIKIKLDTLDNFLSKKIHFLKLDVEGAELDILKGSEKNLQNNCVGIRSEVTFSPVYKNAPLFSEINDYLAKKDFELINFDYDGKGSKFGKYSNTDRFGQLITTDAVWVKKISTHNEKKIEKLFLISTFLFLNNCPDLAIENLLNFVKKNNTSFKRYLKYPIVKFLRKKILLLFKDFLNTPYFKDTDIFNDYKKMFGENFPRLHNFYQKNINNS
jgi:FkbM family methyltransferase